MGRRAGRLLRPGFQAVLSLPPKLCELVWAGHLNAPSLHFLLSRTVDINIPFNFFIDYYGS